MVLWSYKTSGANSWIALTSGKTLVDTFHYFTYGVTEIYMLFGLIALVFAIGRFEFTKAKIYFKLNNIIGKRRNHDLILLINYLFFPLLIALIVGHFIPFYEVGRYEAVVLPAFILLSAWLFSRIKNVVWVGLLIGLLIIFSYLEVIKEKDDIISQVINERSISADLLLLAQNGDSVVFTGLARPTIEYYLNHLNFDKKTFQAYSFPEEMSEHQAYQDINKIMANNKNIMPSAYSLVEKIKSSASGRVWLVFTENNPFAFYLKKTFQSQFVEQGRLLGPSYYIILYTSI